MLKLVVYVSEYTGNEADAATDLNNICRHASEFNARRNISGVLFYENYHFLQAIEGPQLEIDGLMESIRMDSRHRNIDILVEMDISSRYFSRWNMQPINLETSSLFETKVLKKLRDAYMHNLQISDASFVMLIQDILNTPGAEEILKS
ncbi:MAG: BLUF domain-containing protein [Gammaproteobacteria bacterium]|nr:BLUF domain-containing protein [Gammaproteobacteria bacterium]